MTDDDAWGRGKWRFLDDVICELPLIIIGSEQRVRQQDEMEISMGYGIFYLATTPFLATPTFEGLVCDKITIFERLPSGIPLDGIPTRISCITISGYSGQWGFRAPSNGIPTRLLLMLIG